MRRVFSSVVLVFLCSIVINAQITFQKIYYYPGDTTPYLHTTYSVQQTLDGGYMIGGSIQAAIETGSDYLIKTDANGNALWVSGDNIGDGNYSCQQTSDGGYIATSTALISTYWDYDMYVSKYDGSGNVVWARTIGEGSGLADSLTQADDISSVGYSVQQCSDGGYIVAGSTNSVWVTNIYLVRMDNSGNLVWTKSFGGSGVGVTEEAHSVEETTDGGFIIAGYTTAFGAGGEDVYLIKTDISGNLLWSKTYGSNDNDRGYSVRQTSDGGYIIGGYTGGFGAGSEDVFVIKTNAAGNIDWSKTYGGSGGDFGYCVQQTGDGGYVVTGSTTSFGISNIDAYLIKIDSVGNKEWSMAYGDTFKFSARVVDQTADGGYIIGGVNGNPNPVNPLLIKTNSFGSSGGCSEFSPGTIVGNPTTGISSPSTLSLSGGVSEVKYPTVGVGGISDSIHCLLTNVHEETNNRDNFRIYPNPNTGQFNLELDIQHSSELWVVLYQVNGQLVYAKNIASASGIHTLPCGYAEGLYYLKVVTNEGVYTCKIIHQ